MLVDVMSSYCEQYFESTRVWLCSYPYSSLSERQNINIESAKKKQRRRWWWWWRKIRWKMKSQKLFSTCRSFVWNVGHSRFNMWFYLSTHSQIVSHIFYWVSLTLSSFNLLNVFAMHIEYRNRTVGSPQIIKLK